MPSHTGVKEMISMTKKEKEQIKKMIFSGRYNKATAEALCKIYREYKSLEYLLNAGKDLAKTKGKTGVTIATPEGEVTLRETRRTWYDTKLLSEEDRESIKRVDDTLKIDIKPVAQ